MSKRCQWDVRKISLGCQWDVKGISAKPPVRHAVKHYWLTHRWVNERTSRDTYPDKAAWCKASSASQHQSRMCHHAGVEGSRKLSCGDAAHPHTWQSTPPIPSTCSTRRPLQRQVKYRSFGDTGPHKYIASELWLFNIVVSYIIILNSVLNSH